MASQIVDYNIIITGRAYRLIFHVEYHAYEINVKYHAYPLVLQLATEWIYFTTQRERFSFKMRGLHALYRPFNYLPSIYS